MFLLNKLVNSSCVVHMSCFKGLFFCLEVVSLLLHNLCVSITPYFWVKGFSLGDKFFITRFFIGWLQFSLQSSSFLCIHNSIFQVHCVVFSFNLCEIRANLSWSMLINSCRLGTAAGRPRQVARDASDPYTGLWNWSMSFLCSPLLSYVSVYLFIRRLT
jgi:hypothetical protein